MQSILTLLSTYLNIIDPIDPDYRWMGLFKATGCTDPSIESAKMDWWKVQPDSIVVDDMMNYCEKVRDGSATDIQKIRCCGTKDCTVSTCKLQTAQSKH